MTQPTLFNSTRVNLYQVTLRDGALLVKTPYDAAFVAALKTIPSADRRFDPGEKAWLVNPRYGREIERWINAYFGETVTLPTVQAAKAQPTLRLIEVHYLGACKDRDGQAEAYGCDADSNWTFVFPERILRAYFDGTEENTAPTQEKTLYGVLGVTRSASSDEIRTAYRRMAMQWHPDRCKEENAHEIFLRIQEAYQILSDPNQKARYNAGLALEATLGKSQAAPSVSRGGGYRAPLRCGQIMVEGVEFMGRFRVTKILAWEDVFNSRGQTLVSSWPMGAKEPSKVWC